MGYLRSLYYSNFTYQIRGLIPKFDFKFTLDWCLFVTSWILITWTKHELKYWQTYSFKVKIPEKHYVFINFNNARWIFSPTWLMKLEEWSNRTNILHRFWKVNLIYYSSRRRITALTNQRRYPSFSSRSFKFKRKNHFESFCRKVQN